MGNNRTPSRSYGASVDMTTLGESAYLYSTDDSPLSTQGTSDKYKDNIEYLSGELRILVPEETYGSDADIKNYPQTDFSPILDKSIAFAEGLEQEELASQAMSLLNNLKSLVSRVSWDRIEISDVPDLLPFAIEDGSLIFEWIHPNFRIGFNIEPDLSQSGWHLISNRELGNIVASGHLDIRELSKLNLWLLNFLMIFLE